jgi:hypothetical protein
MNSLENLNIYIFNIAEQKSISYFAVNLFILLTAIRLRDLGLKNIIFNDEAS